MEAKNTLAQTLARNRLKREILGDNRRRMTTGCHKQKTPENRPFSAFSGVVTMGCQKWRRRELNPRLEALQYRLLRV
jgi:hypothetical protein